MEHIPKVLTVHLQLMTEKESIRREKCICQDVILKEYIMIIDYNTKRIDYYQTSYTS